MIFDYCVNLIEPLRMVSDNGKEMINISTWVKIPGMRQLMCHCHVKLPCIGEYFFIYTHFNRVILRPTGNSGDVIIKIGIYKNIDGQLDLAKFFSKIKSKEFCQLCTIARVSLLIT